MVRVGGGWDTLENYLNKHDPCRRTGSKSINLIISSVNLFLFIGHRRQELDRQKDIPILAIPNSNVSSTYQKTTPYGKSVTIKTEDFPLTKPTVHDTNLTNAKLLITRDADGRHHIGQITYKSEEDLTQTRPCPHHHPSPTPSPVPVPKIKSVRGTGHLISSTPYNKQSSPSTDHDYSSYTPSSSIEANEHRPYKPELTTRDRSQSNVSHEHFKPSQPMKRSKSAYSEGIIDNIDGYITPSENDFDVSDIGDALNINHDGDDPTNMDEDSLESCEGVLENKKKSIPPPPPTFSDKQPMITKVKSGGICTALYLAQKQRQATVLKNSSPTLSYTRSNTLPDVVEAVKKEEQSQKSRRKSSGNSHRSKSTEFFDKSLLNDMSKLDRDSGFDEQDFRCERLQSSYDDNSSVSSVKSIHSSINRSVSSDLNGQTYRENKAYELRLKALDSNRTLADQCG